MPGFASVDDLINEITVNGKRHDFSGVKIGQAGLVGTWETLWKQAGAPGAGADPAATPGTIYNGNAAGCLQFPNVSTDLRFLLTLGGVATQNCTLMLYDRLTGVSGLSVASTGAKTVNSGALPRYSGTDAKYVQAWLEVTTATTTTAPIVNMNSYTNEAGTAGRSGGNITFPAAATVLGSMIGPLPLQAGDLGVRSVEAGLNVGTAANAGVVNLILIRPLAYLPLIANIWNEVDLVLQLNSLTQILDGHNLALAALHSVTTATNYWWRVTVGHG